MANVELVRFIDALVDGARNDFHKLVLKKARSSVDKCKCKIQSVEEASTLSGFGPWILKQIASFWVQQRAHSPSETTTLEVNATPLTASQAPSNNPSKKRKRKGGAGGDNINYRAPGRSALKSRGDHESSDGETHSSGSEGTLMLDDGNKENISQSSQNSNYGVTNGGTCSSARVVKQHRQQGTAPLTQKSSITPFQGSAVSTVASIPSPAAVTSSHARPPASYIPRYRSAAYAFLRGLYHSYACPEAWESQHALTAKELVEVCQPYTDVPLKFQPHQSYSPGTSNFSSGWVALKATLLPKGLVAKSQASRPVKYSLTPAGFRLAAALAGNTSLKEELHQDPISERTPVAFADFRTPIVVNDDEDEEGPTVLSGGNDADLASLPSPTASSQSSGYTPLFGPTGATVKAAAAATTTETNSVYGDYEGDAGVYDLPTPTFSEERVGELDVDVDPSAIIDLTATPLRERVPVCLTISTPTTVVKEQTTEAEEGKKEFLTGVEHDTPNPTRGRFEAVAGEDLNQSVIDLTTPTSRAEPRIPEQHPAMMATAPFPPYTYMPIPSRRNSPVGDEEVGRTSGWADHRDLLPTTTSVTNTNTSVLGQIYDDDVIGTTSPTTMHNATPWNVDSELLSLPSPPYFPPSPQTPPPQPLYLLSPRHPPITTRDASKESYEVVVESDSESESSCCYVEADVEREEKEEDGGMMATIEELTSTYYDDESWSIPAPAPAPAVPPPPATGPKRSRPPRTRPPQTANATTSRHHPPPICHPTTATATFAQTQDRCTVASFLALARGNASTTAKPTTTTTSNSTPAAFTLGLVIDDRERASGHADNRAYLCQELAKRGLTCQVGHLELGDLLWVLHPATSAGKGASEQAAAHVRVWQCVLERKCVRDLAASIVSGRYARQKARLHACGLPRVLYLVEGKLPWKVKPSQSPPSSAAGVSSSSPVSPQHPHRHSYASTTTTTSNSSRSKWVLLAAAACPTCLGWHLRPWHQVVDPRHHLPPPPRQRLFPRPTLTGRTNKKFVKRLCTTHHQRRIPPSW